MKGTQEVAKRQWADIAAETDKIWKEIVAYGVDKLGDLRVVDVSSKECAADYKGDAK